MIEYDLYTTAAGGTLVASNINTGYSHPFTGTADFFVKTRNSIGDEIDSNQDSGTGVPAYFNATFTITDGINVKLTDVGGTGTPWELSDDSGTTWMSMASYGFVEIPYSGDWIIRKTDGPMNISFYSSSGGNFSRLISATVDSVGSTSAYAMFQDCTGLTSVDITNFDMSQVLDVRYMFLRCQFLTNINGSEIDVSNCTSLDGMFRECSSLTSLDLSTWNTSNVTTTGTLFYGCTDLTTVDISNWDVSKMTNFHSTFTNCVNFTTLISNNTTTIKPTLVGRCFYNCSSLTDIDISNWDTSDCTDFRNMFYGCTNLTCITNIDTTAWGAHKDTMFSGCNALTQPDIAAQNDITDNDGANWTNPGTCP